MTGLNARIFASHFARGVLLNRLPGSLHCLRRQVIQDLILWMPRLIVNALDFTAGC